MARYCGQCGSPIDPRLGFCPKCSPDKIGSLLDFSPSPPVKPDRNTRKKQKKAKRKAAKKAYRATWSIWRKLGDFLWKLVLILAVFWLAISLILGGLAYLGLVEIPQTEALTAFTTVFSFVTDAPEAPADTDDPVSASGTDDTPISTIAPTAALTVPVCSHQWTAANCTDPEVCSLCGEEGAAALGHSWQEATYEHPRTCTRCGLTHDKPLGQVGDIITFGRYEQDNNTYNGPEDLEWEILEIHGNELLLITKYAIDTQSYHSYDTAVTWETCDLRYWLGYNFFQTAFTPEEQAKVLLSSVIPDPNPKFSTEPGEVTQDTVFLLSLPQVSYYFPEDEDRLCYPTPYAKARGAYVSGKTGGCWWWLRTPGNTPKDASSINSDGTIDFDDGSVNSSRGTVRPVMRVDMS